MILKDFFAYAIGKYKLPGNPTLSTTRPEVVQKEMRVLSPDEMRIFIEEVMKETQRIAILTDLSWLQSGRAVGAGNFGFEPGAPDPYDQ